MLADASTGGTGDVAAALLARGHARPYAGRRRQSWCGSAEAAGFLFRLAAVSMISPGLRGSWVVLAPIAAKRRFQLVLIKPSHYDDDGYVIQWWRSSIPSNSLACVYALARDAAERRVLGADVEIDITAFDETNTRVQLDDIVDRIRQHDGFGMVGLVGVQSNQFPRALDIARPLARGRHPGRDRRLPRVRAARDAARRCQPISSAALDLGCTLFAGEAEGPLRRDPAGRRRAAR